MKEKTIMLSSDELHLMLRGSLQWIDVEPRLTASKTGIRKLSEDIIEKKPARKLTEQVGIGISRPQQLEELVTRLEGQPVVWLLGSVGLLTLSTWFYFVLFSK
ncbi:hypothetical protein [Desulfosporosinus sp. Sb-LF]|uniref:hypothetical protein n=1 Tax=Desulfosporosinus sp. Sb-LF TaxID=2560027 RepID=UPI0018EE47E4|nr:hypothetical protein [Desulfosporosinus sp. Sb-LF]